MIGSDLWDVLFPKEDKTLYSLHQYSNILHCTTKELVVGQTMHVETSLACKILRKLFTSENVQFQSFQFHMLQNRSNTNPVLQFEIIFTVFYSVFVMYLYGRSYDVQ